MLATLGILAYVASMMTHEALGHGGYCLAVGGQNVVLTAWWENCHFPGSAPLGIKAAGPGMQFGAGLLAWLLLHWLSPNAVRLRCFVWLYMVFDLLVASGYIAFSGVTNLGDAAELIAPLRPSILWRWALILLGSAVYFLSMLAAAFELKRFAGLHHGMSRLFRLVSIPYVAAGVFACCIGALTPLTGNNAVAGLAAASPTLNQTLGHGAAIGLAAASSFLAGSGMFGLPPLQRGMAASSSTSALYVKWSNAWGIVAATVIAAFLVFVSPGLR